MQQILFFILCTLLGVTLVATALMCYYFDFFNLIHEMKMFRELDRENLYGSAKKDTGGDRSRVILREPDGQVEIRTGLTGEENTAGAEGFEVPHYQDSRLDILGDGDASEREKFIQFRQKTSDLEADMEENITCVLDESMIRTTTVSLGAYRPGSERFMRNEREGHPYTEVLRDERMVCPATSPEESGGHTELLGVEGDYDTDTALLTDFPEEKHTALLADGQPGESHQNTELLSELLHDVEPFPHTALLEDMAGSHEVDNRVNATALLDGEDSFRGTEVLETFDTDLMTALLELGEIERSGGRYHDIDGYVSPEDHTAVLTEGITLDGECRCTELLEDDSLSRFDQISDVRFTELLEESVS